MLIIFRNQKDMEMYKSKVNEIISTNSAQSISSYEIQFSEQYQSNSNLQYSENSNIMSSMKYFIKYDKIFHTGQTFYILNMDALLNHNNTNENEIDSSLLLTILNHINSFSTSSHEVEEIMNVYDILQELWECNNKSWGPCFDFINSCLTPSPPSTSCSAGSSSIFSSKIVILMNANKNINTNNTTTNDEQPQQQLPHQQSSHGEDYLMNFPHHFLLSEDDTASDYSLDGGLWSITFLISTTTIINNNTDTQSSTNMISHDTIDSNNSNNNSEQTKDVILKNPNSPPLTDKNNNNNDNDDDDDGHDDDHMNNDDGDGDWEMVTDELADLHIVEPIDYNTATTTTTTTTNNSTSFQQQQQPQQQQLQGEQSMRLSTTPIDSSIQFTYKDIVLKPATPKSSTYCSSISDHHHHHHHHHNQQISLHEWKERQQQQHEWKPNVILIKTPHIRSDRVYGAHQDILIDDEGNGCWDLVDAQAGLKFNTAVAKRNKVTMLTPKVQEQKEKRIAEKAK